MALCREGIEIDECNLDDDDKTCSLDREDNLGSLRGRRKSGDDTETVLEYPDSKFGLSW